MLLNTQVLWVDRIGKFWGQVVMVGTYVLCEGVPILWVLNSDSLRLIAFQVQQPAVATLASLLGSGLARGISCRVRIPAGVRRHCYPGTLTRPLTARHAGC